jgi:hypothetical protein
MGAYRNVNAPLITVPTAGLYSPYTDGWDLAEKSVATSTAAVMVDGTDIFTIAGGPIVILELISVCVTANNGTASTLQWRADGTDGAATTFTGASASLASAAAGTLAVCHFTATTTAPVLYTAGVGISRPTSTAHGMVVPAGIIETVIAVGSTTGTWRHYLRYRPMARGTLVTAI